MFKLFVCAILAAAICLANLCACSSSKKLEPMAVGSNPDLSAHTTEFKREVIKVTDGVYVAIGFALANSILLEGEDGVVIVDTLESEEAARAVKAAFNEITQKPVKAIIYTHFHSDHCFGATIFAGDDKPDIYSHESTLRFLDRIVGITTETTYRRASRQFGTLLPEGGVENCGIGPFLEFGPNNTIGLIRPNKTFPGESVELDIAGMKIELIHAPGETDDQILVWLADKKVLLAADNYYKSFPNLYAIRGTAYRDVTKWVKSLDKMRALRPEYLVPSHTRPLIGADTIHEVLTNYRDAIQFVHDQTIRGINNGLTTEQIVELVKLPPHLAQKPYLHEYYGTVEWSVRAIFNGYLGWFGGNATDLFPLSQKERAKRFSDLAGGREALLKYAKKAALKGDHQWVLELSDQLLQLNPNAREVLNLKAASLTALGEKQIASTARNYYLTQALETSGKLHIERRKNKEKEFVHSLPLRVFFEGMAVRLDPDKSADVDQVMGFRFPDTGEGYTVHVRRGVAEVKPRFPDKPDVTITVDSFIWKEIVAKMRNPAVTLVSGDIKIEGGTINLVKILSLFQTG
ncbi:MAG: MBL fold metallo-hydrolase [Proteobacteria bacterium]|nr:MBL fold metallo-hydrolase [Pseudomonadota bacterium]